MPINRLPTEIVVHTATCFGKGRDLVNATAICQRWRTILISSPQLWCNVGGSSLEIQTCLARSGFMPIVVNLSSPELAELIVPHTSRLVGLVLPAEGSRSNFRQISGHLRHPIPTLHTFRISTSTYQLHTVEFASDVRDAFFIHSKKLELEGVHSFRGPPGAPDSFKPFPNVTEIVFRANLGPTEIDDLLDTLERLPALERASITLATSWRPGHRRTITLPRVQEMTVLLPEPHTVIPPIFGQIKYPNLTLLRLQGISSLSGRIQPIFPADPFEEYMPNLTDLPELQVSINMTSIEFAFRNPRATFSCVTDRVFSTSWTGEVIWGSLPLHTVRKLVVDVWDPRVGIDSKWFVELLRDLVNLEHLEFGGVHPPVVRHLCQGAIGRGLPVPIRTLVGRAAGGC